ncbi:hypothetical protein QBC44DRAFT_305147 [Cladorrhinum sp. PSN332]|nr:hypothetical protein QBC44DRAFT_305147 [Cladorrhinum sp. PSN332]
MQLSLSALALAAQAGLSLGAAISKAAPEAAIPASTPDSALPTPTNHASNSVKHPIPSPQETLSPNINEAALGGSNSNNDMDDLDDLFAITRIPEDDYNTPPGNPLSNFWPWPMSAADPPFNSDGCGQFKNKKECDEFRRKHELQEEQKDKDKKKKQNPQ